MKVFVELGGAYDMLVQRIIEEGDTLVGSKEEATLVVAEPTWFPREFVKSLVPDAEDNGVNTVFYVTKIFNGKEFLDQTIVGVPLIGTMNASIGARRPTGSVCLHAVVSDELESIFQNVEVLTVLKNMSYTGFVTAVWTETKLKGLMTGIPSYGVCAMFEGLRQTVVQQFEYPRHLNSMVSIGLLLSQFPWPMNAVEKAIVPRPHNLMWKHCWFFSSVKDNRTTLILNSNQVAVVTGFARGGRLDEAVGSATGRVLKTLGNFELNEKQYRTDPKRASMEVFGRMVSNRQLLSPVWGSV